MIAPCVNCWVVLYLLHNNYLGVIMEIITTREAGKILGCSAAWVRELLHRKEITGQQITPRQWVVDKASVLNFRNRREIRKRQKRLV